MNKAGYMATLVVCKWAGEVLEKIWAGAVCSKSSETPKSKKGTDQLTDRPTN